jgi:hypothetical protein
MSEQTNTATELVVPQERQEIIDQLSNAPIIYRGARVLTFDQIDRIHGAKDAAKQIFNNHEEQFIEDEDYFRVPYVEWSQEVNDGVSETPSKRGGYRGERIYLTKRGYMMIVKALTDPLAWAVQRLLVNVYFQVKKAQQTLPDNFNDMMDALVSMGKKNLDTTSMIAICVGHGFQQAKELLVSLDNRLIATETRLLQRIEEITTRPKARNPWKGRAPDAIPYAELRREFTDKALWHMSEFGHLAPENFYDGVYHKTAALLNFNVRTHRTAYAAALSQLIGRAVNPKSISLVEIAERYGILRDVYRIAMGLTENGTTCINYMPYHAVDEVAYPVTLLTRGERSGMPLFPAWAYELPTARPVGHRRGGQTTEGNQNLANAEATGQHVQAEAEKAKKMAGRVDAVTDNISTGGGQVAHAAPAEAALPEVKQLPDTTTVEPFLAAQQPATKE